MLKRVLLPSCLRLPLFCLNFIDLALRLGEGLVIEIRFDVAWRYGLGGFGLIAIC